jgi:hypothetical protein
LPTAAPSSTRFAADEADTAMAPNAKTKPTETLYSRFVLIVVIFRPGLTAGGGSCRRNYPFGCKTFGRKGCTKRGILDQPKAYVALISEIHCCEFSVET